MPIKGKDFKKELEAAGYSVERTKRGHFNVINSDGKVIVNYAVGHGRNKNKVLDCYLRLVRKVISERQVQ